MNILDKKIKKILASIIILFSIINTSFAQYGDPKWEFGGEVGFAWVGYPGEGLNLDLNLYETTSSKHYTKRENRGGFRALVSAKYNLIGRIQILGGVGVVRAKGEIGKGNSPNATDERIMQEFTLIEMPTYFRLHLLNKRRSTKNKINIFLDLGTSLKAPIKSDLSFSKRENSANPEGELQVESYFHVYSAIGILANNRTSIAITSSGINSQAKDDSSIKYWSRLKSISVAVFF